MKDDKPAVHDVQAVCSAHLCVVHSVAGHSTRRYCCWSLREVYHYELPYVVAHRTYKRRFICIVKKACHAVELEGIPVTGCCAISGML